MGENNKDVEWKKLKLISVAFKEASLDTPSFRATVNFFQARLEAFEDWIDKSVAFFENRYAVSFGDFQRAEQTFLTQLLPPPLILSNGFVANQSATPLLVEAFNTEYFEFANRILKMFAGTDSSYADALLELMNGAIEPYKARRSDFEYYQGKFDGALAKYCAIKVSNTSIEPVKIRDEALQVFELRKSYLRSSLELVGAISRLKLSLDKFLTQAVSLVNEKNTFWLKDIGKKIDLTASLTENVAAYADWVADALQAAESLEKDMERAKQQVMDYTLDLFQPSPEISEYNVKGINLSKLLSKKAPSVTAAPERSGWLYMKTSVGTPSRDVWVRRWCFLSNSVFGLFLLSPSKTYVEETDKFGILLTDVRYDPDEDRKFCFEVKIRHGKSSEANGDKHTRVVFQAETLKELKQWMVAFEAAKRYAAKLDSSDLRYNYACRRISPEYFEFASSTTTSVDQLLTTYDDNSMNLLEELDVKLPSFDLASIPGRNYYQYQVALAPMATKLTQMAIFGGLIRQNTYLPNALLANIWGSTNWSDYAVFKQLQKDARDEKSRDGPSNTTDSQVSYPSFYSEKMIISDIQFKSLFFSIDQNLTKFPDELLLFSFTSFWCPNKRQKFSTTCYVTMDRIFCYMNSLGFIGLTHKKFSDLVSVEVDPASKNSLRIYEADGSQLKISVYFTDRRLIACKLQCLLENIAFGKSKNEEQMLKQLELVERNFQSKLKDEKLEKMRSSFNNEAAGNAVDSSSNLYPKTFWSMSATAAELSQRCEEFQSSYTKTYHHVYDISSKGLMHVMFGDHSSAFPRCLYLSNKDGSSNVSRCWIKEDSKNGDGKTQLVRVLQFHLNLTNGFLNGMQKGKSPTVLVKQKIVKLIENKYYEVDQDYVTIKVPFCRPLCVKVKYVITEPHESPAPDALVSSSGSILLLYYKLEFMDSKTGKKVEATSFLERTIFRMALQATNREFLLIRKIIRYYLEKIGRHGKVIEAIRLCGMLGVSPLKEDSSQEKAPFAYKEPVVNYTVPIVFKVLMKSLVYKVTGFALILIRLVIGTILLTISSLTQINRNLILGLILSGFINVFLFGRSTLAYWSAQRSDNIFQDYMQGKQDIAVQRSISIKDLDLLSQNLAFESDNLPFQKFNKTHSAENYKFKETRLEFAQRRNELLVELKILQNMERELLQTNYRGFLLHELDKCHAVEKEISAIWEQDHKLRDYCSSCLEELNRLSDLLL